MRKKKITRTVVCDHTLWKYIENENGMEEYVPVMDTFSIHGICMKCGTALSQEINRERALRKKNHSQKTFYRQLKSHCRRNEIIEITRRLDVRFAGSFSTW